MPEGTPVPPQAVPFSAALTLTDKTLPGSNTTVIDTMGNHVGGEKTSKSHISITWGVGRGALGTRSYSHGKFLKGLRNIVIHLGVATHQHLKVMSFNVERLIQ